MWWKVQINSRHYSAEVQVWPHMLYPNQYYHLYGGQTSNNNKPTVRWSLEKKTAVGSGASKVDMIYVTIED